jgi:outer membrane protein OmpA-like peptidoglycan-associated protein
VGAQAGVLAAAAVGPELEALEDELDGLAGRRAPVPLRISRDGEVLKLGLGAADSFAPGSGELRAAALATYAGVARVLARRPGTVAHVRVLGEAASEPSAGLPARRAASLEAYLVAQGVPGARLRAQGAVGADAVEVLIKPIIAGREAEAWVPPS